MGVLHTYACCFSYSSHLREPICGRTCCVSPLGAAASAQAPLRLLLLHVSDTSYALLGAVRLSAAHPARQAKQRRAALGLPVTPQPPGSGRNHQALAATPPPPSARHEQSHRNRKPERSRAGSPYYNSMYTFKVGGSGKDAVANHGQEEVRADAGAPLGLEHCIGNEL